MGGWVFGWLVWFVGPLMAKLLGGLNGRLRMGKRFSNRGVP